ncbi:MAG TPA: AmmeMemoRadiSam system radical SAM enzyme [Treponema sp.]|nr:AmmeMemoRadiSam system radical SAM enzyme [Treponema sp.]
MGYHHANFWETIGSDKSVRCLLCPHYCVISAGSAGKCGVRVNRDGVLVAEQYGTVSALSLDPIEKKPLARFKPGSLILSAGGYGCNMTCSFCQNWHISQTSAPVASSTEKYGFPRPMSPREITDVAISAVPRGNCGLAFTYNEPTINYEFVRDTFELIHAEGLAAVMVTNGYINTQPLGELLPLVDAMNIDLKAFSNSYYQKLCGARLDPVQKTIAQSAQETHVEVTTLIIPGWNSDPKEVDSISSWLAAIRPDIPLHLSRHHPDFHMSEPPSISIDELFSLAEIARKHLEYVYTGNVQL